MKYILILFIFISLGANSQVWHLKKQVDFRYSADSTKTSIEDFIAFDAALYEGNGDELPFFSDIIEWKTDAININESIVFPVYEEFEGNSLLADKYEIQGDSLNYDFSLEFMKKVPFLQIKVLPFRKNAQTGKLERLRSFVIRLEKTTSTSPEKNKSKKAFTYVNSVLSEGSWYKIKVGKSGIYRLSFEQISSMSIGNPANVRIFGFGGEVLPEDCRKGEKDDLQAVPVYMNKGSDGIFNAGDYILFYTKGSVGWTYDPAFSMFRHKLNPYSDFSYYFVTSGTGPDLISPEEPVLSAANKFSEAFDYHDFIEEEINNVILSGKQWFGDLLTSQFQTFGFTVPELVSDQKVEILGQIMAKATDSSYIQLSYNNSLVTTFVIRPADLSNYTSIFGYAQEKKVLLTPLSNSIDIKLKYINPTTLRRAWPDYLILNARAKLKMGTDILEFREYNTTGTGNITQFTVSSATANTQVWDVSNQNSIKKIESNLTGSDLIFKVNTESLREFIAVNTNGSFASPILQGDDVGAIENQNLHGNSQPDMVIIAHRDFIAEAEVLADYRQVHDELDVMLVDPEQIYNEFSSGTPDISAVRNFMKMLYNRAEGDSSLLPQYLLLFGDGSYDNKGINDKAENFILTYQSDNSLNPTASYVSDDFFGLLDPGETMTSGLLDIGIGRLPVKTDEESAQMVKKLLDYELPDKMGNWRNNICLIADDEDGNIHLSDADGMANYIETNYPSLNISKIYLDAYKQVSFTNGAKYPDVNLAISDQVAKGALIINYTGHGGTDGWAHEIILNLNDIDGWRNRTKLPLFMTATCDFAPYDHFQKLTPGERVLLNPEGGGIALLTTTRLVYSQPNRVLNEKFYEIVFQKDENGKNYRLGDIIAYSKNQAGSGINKRNFTLLGDPSQRLASPDLFVFADSLNGVALNEAVDTLKALGKVRITGHVEDMNGNVLTDFNGRVYPSIFDKKVTLQTLANDGGSKKSFSSRNNLLYKGKSLVKNGKFDFEFIVPKDINYAFGSGKLSLYAEDSVSDASGNYNAITIGGSFENAQADLEGPEIKVYMNSPTFKSGGITDENPILYVEVMDEFGVNTTGNGIGHDISAELDEDQNLLMLNAYYESNLNSYKSGVIQYPFNNLEAGSHSVSVKVWDIYNNSSTGTTDFIVLKSENLILKDLLNYPNPFSDYTNISFSHNKAGLDIQIIVDIFDLEGKIVSTIKATETNTGFRSRNIYWDGSGANGAEGIYIYRIRATSSDGKTDEKSGKLIIAQ